MDRDEQPATGEPFELAGGALCLDFANTWGNHADPGSDRLRDYAHLVAFARQTGCLPDDTATRLSQAAAADTEGAAAALLLGRELRQVIYRIFSNRAGGRDAPSEEVGWINAVLGEALSRRRLERKDGGFVWGWENADGGDLRAPVWPIIESAAALLASKESERIRECDAGDCNWLFLDRSRSRTRRWCSMTSCGNRAKARRHYRRQRGADRLREPDL